MTSVIKTTDKRAQGERKNNTDDCPIRLLKIQNIKKTTRHFP